MKAIRDGRTIKYPMVQFRKDTWEIDEFDLASMFLLIGEERALLIDCGMGVGDLRGAIQGLTDKPVTVVITHNHLDHTGNACQFSEIWMNPADLGDPIPGDYERRKHDAMAIALRQHANIGNGLYAAYPLYGYDLETDLSRNEGPTPIIHPLEEGMKFDLGGGRIVTAYSCPGHTAGQMMLLDSQTKLLFCGDALNYCLGVGAVPIQQTIAYLSRIQEWMESGEVVGIYNGHHDFRAQGRPLANDCLSNALALVIQYQSGDYALVEIPNFFGPASGFANMKVLQLGRSFLLPFGFGIPKEDEK